MVDLYCDHSTSIVNLSEISMVFYGNAYSVASHSSFQTSYLSGKVSAGIGSLISTLSWLSSTSEKCNHLSIVENMPVDRKASNRRVLFLLEKSVINTKGQERV